MRRTVETAGELVALGNDEDWPDGRPPGGGPVLRWASYPIEELPIFDVAAFGREMRESGATLDNYVRVVDHVRHDGSMGSRSTPFACDRCGRHREVASNGTPKPFAVLPVPTGRLVIAVGLCDPCVTDLVHPTDVLVVATR